tara:strand:+ start:65 stop:463 length:399 start_codon:yes stop_codon:yes gene_type:complete
MIFGTSRISRLLTTLFIILILDFVYFSFFKGYFLSVISKVQRSPVVLNIAPMFLIYVILASSLNYFIIEKKGSILDAFLFGAVVYSVYELTNYVIFKNWPIKMVLIDSLWGGILMASTVYISRTAFKLVSNL